MENPLDGTEHGAGAPTAKAGLWLEGESRKAESTQGGHLERGLPASTNCRVLERHSAGHLLGEPVVGPLHAGEQDEVDGISGEPSLAGLGVHLLLTWVVEGRPSLRRLGATWLAFTSSSREPFAGQDTRAAASTLIAPSPPWRATLARVWVSRGREGHRLLGAWFTSLCVWDRCQTRLLLLKSLWDFICQVVSPR